MRFLFSFILSGCYLSGICQEVLSPGAFLATAKMYQPVLLQQKKVEFLRNTSHELPIVEKLEFRTETNDFDLEKQEYLLRLSPSSPRHRKTQRNFHQANIRLNEIERQLLFGEALKERYASLLKFIHSQRLLATKYKLKKLMEDKVQVLTRSIALPNFDILDLIEATDENNELEREILRLETDWEVLNKNMQTLARMNHRILIREDMFLKINDLKAIVERLNLASETPHLLLTHRKAKINLVRQEYDLEHAKTRTSLGYIQAKYSGGNNNIFRETFSVGFGIQLPMKGAGRLDLNELELEKISRENNYQNLKTALDVEKKILSLKLESLFREREMLRQQIENSQAQHALREYSKVAEASPMALLKMRETTLNEELILKKLESQIFLTYLELLDIAGKLTEMPLKNYLSKDLEAF